MIKNLLRMLALLRRGKPPTPPQGGYGGMPKPEPEPSNKGNK